MLDATTSDPIVTRTATLEDAGEIFSIQRAAFVGEAQRYREPELPPLTETIDEIRDAIKSRASKVMVCEIENDSRRRIVASGRITVHDGVGHVGRLAVTPDLHGAGIGGTLLTTIHDISPEARVFELHAGGESADTMRWYAAHGYHPVGATKDSAGVDLAVMQRPQLRHDADAPPPRVACYVTRKGSSDVLVFSHVDQPDAGLQVPAGGILPGETVAAAATREVSEETGLDCRFSSVLGYSDRSAPDDGSPRRTAYVYLTVDYAPDAWHHHVTGPGDDTGLTFACTWASRDVELADHDDEFL